MKKKVSFILGTFRRCNVAVWASVVVAAVVCVACGNKSKTVPLAVVPDKVAFEAAGGTQSVTVEADGDWVISDDCEWCSFSEYDGSGSADVTLTCLPNETLDPRSALIPVRGGNRSVMLTVTQNGRTGALLSEHTFNIGVAAAELLVNVEAKSSWSLEIAEGGEWCEVSPENGEGDGAFVILVSENETFDVHTMRVVVTCEGVTDEVTVTQSAKVPEIETPQGSLGSYDIVEVQW